MNREKKTNKMQKDQVAKAITLLQSLENDPQSFEFKHPVDYIGLGLIDYPKIIKHPMDLSTAKVITLIITIGQTKERKLF